MSSARPDHRSGAFARSGPGSGLDFGLLPLRPCRTSLAPPASGSEFPFDCVLLPFRPFLLLPLPAVRQSLPQPEKPVGENPESEKETDMNENTVVVVDEQDTDVVEETSAYEVMLLQGAAY